jgi:hypothetical protein
VNFPLNFNFDVASGFRDMLPAMEWKIDRCRTKKVKIALYLIKIAKKGRVAAGGAKLPLPPQAHIGSIAGWPDSE